MHTVSTYPTNDKDANLNMIETLRNRYNCKVGLSSHEVGRAVSVGAAALGIIIRKTYYTWIELCMALIRLPQWRWRLKTTC